MFKRLIGLVATGAIACAALMPTSSPAAEPKVRVLLLDGQNNHNWRATSPVMKQVLEQSGRFTVDVSSNLKEGDMPGQISPTVPFPPDLSKYDVVVSNYNGAPWPSEFNVAFEERVRTGKIGLVIVHAANNAFGGWPEFNRMIGMGWRNNMGGARLYVDEAGKEVRVPSGEGDGSSHKYVGEFHVTLRDPNHPVTKGMPKEWLHVSDELYDNMRGPIENVHLLSTAFSKGTNVHEPMIWTVKYGQGRVFHTPLGHAPESMRCVGFITTLLRGSEWAATGKVTLPIPANFPTADKTSTIPAN